MSLEFDGRYFGNYKYKDYFYSSNKVKKKKFKIYGIKIFGTFTLKNLENNNLEEYKIGVNVKETDLIIEKIINLPINSKFKTQTGKEVQLISRNLRGKLK